MAVEPVNDENYSDFRNSSRTALVVSTSTCQACREYFPVIETLSGQMPYIRFGKTVLDRDRSIQLKREYPDLGSWMLPTTLLFLNQREAGRIFGVSFYPQALAKIQEALVLGTTVYAHNGSGIYVPASIKKIKGLRGPYTAQLLEESGLGQRGMVVALNDGNFKWNLEERV
ncbi:MAG: thioredoxin family protein [Candidatus Pacearchaeota archaeon]|nr:thioredoxin family protein [Candidatus Pacearchaeota archaeon]